MELSKWGNGTTCLCFWDSLHGKDRIFKLSSDGAFKADEDDCDVFYSVDLCAELLKLVEEFEN